MLSIAQGGLGDASAFAQFSLCPPPLPAPFGDPQPQYEALGLQWSDAELDKGTIRVRHGRLRLKYEHGCGGTCGRKPG